MKELKLKLITVLLIMVLMLITSSTVFGATGSLTVRWVPDVSNAIEGKEVKVTLSITDFSNVDTSLPLIGSATLQYDTSIFSSIKVEGKNSWAATQGGENTLLLESPMSGTINEGEIATITLTINSNVTTFDTEIKLNSFELTNDDGMEEEEANIDISNMNLTATARVNSGSDNEADNPQNPSDDNNNQGSTETPDAEDPSDDNQNNEDEAPEILHVEQKLYRSVLRLQAGDEEQRRNQKERQGGGPLLLFRREGNGPFSHGLPPLPAPQWALQWGRRRWFQS